MSASTWRKTVAAGERGTAKIGKMLEVRLRSGAVVAFDGRVLEVFEHSGGSQRFHVARLPLPRLVENGDGQAQIVLGDRGVTLPVASAEAPACRRLIAAVEQARAADERLDGC